jgi:hypothetical protein
VSLVTHNAGSIFAPVSAFAFTAAQFEDCKEFLATRAANTEIVPVVDEAQLSMTADGRLSENGYRFNAIGFAALSNSLSSGLNVLFTELSGENMRGVQIAERATDVAAAVNIYNVTLRIRFEALRERSLLVNHREQSVEGFLGLDHRLLENSTFLNIVTNELFDKQPQAEFSRAELVGRALRLYFINPATRRTDIYSDPRHTFAAGWCFSNREDVGNAIHASTCIYTRFGIAVEPPHAAARLAHMGADLSGRTAILISRTAEKEIDMNLVAKQIQRLAQLPLGFSDDKTTNDAAHASWIANLLKFKIAKDEAKRVVKNASTVGADLAPRDPLDAYSKETLAARNGYDLFCSILRCSKNQYHGIRDALQTTAMKLLIPTKKTEKRN